MPDDASAVSGSPGALLFLGVLVVAIVIIGVIVKQRSGNSRTAIPAFFITAAIIFVAACIVVDQYNVASAELCYSRMKSALPCKIRESSGYYLEVRGDGTAWCKCHGTKARVENYLRSKYSSPFSGPITRLRHGLLPASP
jgi:hypothetical protein